MKTPTILLLLLLCAGCERKPEVIPVPAQPAPKRDVMIDTVVASNGSLVYWIKGESNTFTVIFHATKTDGIPHTLDNTNQWYPLAHFESLPDSDGRVTEVWTVKRVPPPKPKEPTGERTVTFKIKCAPNEPWGRRLELVGDDWEWISQTDMSTSDESTRTVIIKIKPSH